MINKTDKHLHYFETQLSWKGGRSGKTTVNGVDTSIEVATPHVFPGGIAGVWSPEHLFLSSLSSCLMTTYLAIAEKKRLAIADFTCGAIGRIQLVDGYLEFTEVDLYPKVYVSNEAEIPLANEVLLKAYKHCIIANSIRSMLVHHGEVLVAETALQESIY